MKPVMQSALYLEDAIHNGDCLVACYASLLNLPLWMVPPFHLMYGRPDWQMRLDEWLCVLGYEVEFTDGHDAGRMPEFYIACGKTERGTQHAVIYSNGKLAHDPHYSGDGIVEVSYTYHLIPSDVVREVA